MQPPAELPFHDEADLADPVVQSFLARIPEARRLHQRLGLTDEESWRTLRDLPRHARLDRLLHGTPGLRKEAEILSPISNIVRFQQRFTPTSETARHDGDADVLEFVFHTLEPDLGRLPRETSLQRALLDHLGGGGHFHAVAGTLAL